MGTIFSVEKEDTHKNVKLNYMFWLTKGVVDDLKQSKVAGCYTIHP